MMLERVMERLRGGGVTSLRELARELGTTETLVEMMLQDLERMGYVRRIAFSGCSGDCAQCADHASGACGTPCAVASSGHVWTLTSKPRWGTDKRPQDS
jgi:hypothetical protein